MGLFRPVLICLLLPGGALGQLLTENPLDAVRNQVDEVLTDAGVPFTAEQQRQISLLLEDQRRASEELFGEIMDFSSGVPEGADQDRAIAAIQWMHDEFRRRLSEYLTPSQRATWEAFESRGVTIGAEIEGANLPGAETARIQEIRVTNNPFSAESDVTFASRWPIETLRTEIIERGGAGAFHGNLSMAFQDDVLNARNPAATNKPSYRERTISGNISGPVIRNRLTATLSLRDNRRENVGTVNALTLDGPFTLGITRPNVNRSYAGRGILQLGESQSLHFGVEFSQGSRENLDMGDFTLPERGANAESHSTDLDLRHLWIVSERSVYETRFSWRKDRSETRPITTGVAINVLDAFNGGGGQLREETDGAIYEFGNLLYRTGDRLTLRVGMTGIYRTERLLHEANFLGLFTFSDLESFRNGRPRQYDVNRGNPLLEIDQLDLGFFVQNDFQLTNRFTLMFGTRYQWQTNLSNKHDLDPRLNFAYAIGSSTVLRGGAGIFHTRFPVAGFEELARFDGTRQFGLRVSEPGWPDPFQSGDAEIVPPPSRYVATADLTTGYFITQNIAIEQNLPGNLFLTLSYDRSRSMGNRRIRNINTPLPGTITEESPDGIKPFPNEGDIIERRSTGVTVFQNVRIHARQRFSVFNVVANYRFNWGYSDGRGSFPASDAYDLGADWGRSEQFPEHDFTAGLNSRLPLDVYLTTTVSARSGDIYTVTTGTDDNRDGFFTDRPAGEPFNGATGPSYFALGFNLSKAFQLRQSTGSTPAGPRLSIFANVNNAFNRTNLRAPSGVLTSRNFGRSTSAYAPREIEVGMRFQF